VIGVYGMLSFTVSRRAHEIGVRMALGADSARIARLILKESITPTAAGIGIGIAGSLAAGRYLQTLLYDIRPADPVTFVFVFLLLGAIAMAASFAPARRAARLDPGTVLRAE
jgi:putative ABC transport system permease protein